MVKSIPRSYRWIARFLRLNLRAFFRGVEVTGLENVPREGGGLVIAWHPNGLVDPGLLLAYFPRQIVFGARDGLFRWPLLGWLMRAVGTVPIYRRKDALIDGDENARKEGNSRSLEALAGAIAEGSFAALFPEGESHDLPHLQELRSGAARLFYRATELVAAGSPPPSIVPVGLHYDRKRIFSSRVLVEIHPPLELPATLVEQLPAEAGEAVERERVELLTAEFERVLGEVVLATESWELHHLMHRARKLIRAERAREAGAILKRPGMEERTLGFARLWKAYQERSSSHSTETRRLQERVAAYDRDLAALGLEDHELDRPPGLSSPKMALMLALQTLLVFLVLPPLLVVGWVVNLPTSLGLLWLAKTTAKKLKDEASVKILIGSVAFPATWLVVALLVTWGGSRLQVFFPEVPHAPLLTAALVFVLSGLGGLVALQYQRLAAETIRALRVRLTRWHRSGAIRRLLEERALLFERLMVLAEGLQLPGEVAADGRVVALASGREG